MTGMLRTAWEDYIAPMFQRPRSIQAAALCYRGLGDHKEVLLITSRDTGRWILPKGWLMRGLDAREAAMREAWEEAGVARGHGDAAPIGSYSYDKRLDDGLSLPVETLVFAVAVETIKDDFPEASERQRKWVSISDATNLVDEPGLKSILRNLH